MGTKKEYKLTTREYEDKLKRVMERMGVKEGDYSYDWTRTTAYIRFCLKGQWYQFDHSTDKANATGKFNLVYGTDVFAQLVIALEDLARMSERGIYELGTWLAGMKFLPEYRTLPDCFTKLGFEGNNVPSKNDLEARYKNLLKSAHPDGGGNTEEFMELQDNMKKCMEYISDYQDK